MAIFIAYIIVSFYILPNFDYCDYLMALIYLRSRSRIKESIVLTRADQLLI